MQKELGMYNEIEECLDECGVRVDCTLKNFTLNKDYHKVDKKVAGKVDAILQQIPAIMNGLANQGDVYRVFYDKGLGVLQESAQHPGRYLANVVKANGKNNGIVDVATLQKMSAGPQIVNGVFAAMSMVTGQYYMDQINHSLKEIEKSVASVRQFLEDDKKSKLQSEEEFLKMTQQTMRYISQNESQMLATISSVQQIRMNALANINFYRAQINDLNDLCAEKDKADNIIENIQQKCFQISEYWYSLYLYCFAASLEPIVARNNDEEYLSIIKNDMIEKCEQYKESYQKWKSMLQEYIESAHAFEDNKFLAAYKKIGVLKFLNPYALGIYLAVDIADDIDKKAKKRKKESAQDSFKLNPMCEDLLAIENKQTELELYNTLNNGKLEIVKYDDDLYIRFGQNENIA